MSPLGKFSKYGMGTAPQLPLSDCISFLPSIDLANIFSPLNQFSSVPQSCLIFWNPMDCSTPGLPVHHQLLKLVQMHVHRVGDVIQPSHPLSSPFPIAFNLSQLQIFSNESVLHIRWPKYWSFSFTNQSFQWIFKTDLLYDGMVGSPCTELSVL